MVSRSLADRPLNSASDYLIQLLASIRKRMNIPIQFNHVKRAKAVKGRDGQNCLVANGLTLGRQNAGGNEVA